MAYCSHSFHLMFAQVRSAYSLLLPHTRSLSLAVFNSVSVDTICTVQRLKMKQNVVSEKRFEFENEIIRIFSLRCEMPSSQPLCTKYKYVSVGSMQTQNVKFNFHRCLSCDEKTRRRKKRVESHATTFIFRISENSRSSCLFQIIYRYRTFYANRPRSSNIHNKFCSFSFHEQRCVFSPSLSFHRSRWIRVWSSQ